MNYDPRYAAPHPHPFVAPAQPEKKTDPLRVLGVIGLSVAALALTCTGYMAVFGDEIEANRRSDEKLVAEGPETLELRARSLLGDLTEADLEIDKPCPESVPANPRRFVATSLTEIADLAPDAVTRRPDPLGGYYTSDRVAEVAPAELRGVSDYRAAKRLGAILDEPYIAIFIPERGAFPEAIDDQTFRAGFFEGTVALADFQAGRLLCHARLQASSSEKLVGGPSVGIGLARGLITIPVGGGGPSLDEDYTQNFHAAVAGALLRITGGASS